ncbi:MAG TPA: energy transducer TonB [Pyrinomonadaceae bacterium]|nr:energy transducer TonB [Pyrinomonadaceae bacterium]
MCCLSFWKKFVPFALTIFFGVLTVSLLQKENSPNKIRGNPKSVSAMTYPEQGTGQSSGCTGKKSVSPNNSKTSAASNSEKESLQIISKPKPDYTDEARQNQVAGTVRLRVDFLASGQIGNVSSISGLPDGLTEQAITAAKQIKFKPAAKNGKSITATKIVEYNFTIY